MVTLVRTSNDPYHCTTDLIDVHKVSNVERIVPREWINEDGDHVTEEFYDYALPLIQGEVRPILVNGIPRHLYFKNK